MSIYLSFYLFNYLFIYVLPLLNISLPNILHLINQSKYMGREAQSNSVDLDQWPQNVLNTNGLKFLKRTGQSIYAYLFIKWHL